MSPERDQYLRVARLPRGLELRACERVVWDPVIVGLVMAGNESTAGGLAGQQAMKGDIVVRTCHSQMVAKSFV